MKTKLILTLSAVMALGLSACGGDDDDDKKDDNDQAECTSDAQCADRTDGKTECDTANKVCVEPEAPPVGEGAMKISQIYLGGTNTAVTSAYDHTYVELFNAGETTVNLTGYSLLYGGKTGKLSDVVSLSSKCANGNCNVPPGGYFLMQLKTSSGADDTPVLGFDIDLEGNPNIGENGTFAITTKQISVGAECADVKAVAEDLLGIGTKNTCAENAAMTGIGAEIGNRATKAYARKGNGCTDSNDNSQDFDLIDAAARTMKTTPAPCTAE